MTEHTIATREEWLAASATWQLLDRAPLGRNEGWMRRHDEYEVEAGR